MAGEVRDQAVSRRTLLKGAAAGAAGIAAGAVVGPAIRRGVVSAQGTTTVRLTGAPSSDVESQLVQQVLKTFESKYPNIKTKWEPVPSDYPTKLQTDLAAGTVADVFYLDSLPAPDLMSKGLLLQVDSYMQKAGVKPTDFYPGLISAFQYQGKTFGLPKDWSSLATVYDQKSFQDAEIAAAPTTWDELKTVAKKLKDKSGQAPIVYGPNFDRFIAFLYQAGGAVLNPKDTEVLLGSPATQTALDFYYGMYKDGLVATYADVGAQWPGDAFAKDLAAIVFEGNWMFPFLKSNAPNKKVGVAALPAGPGGKATMAFTVCYGIYAKSKVADAAWTLVNYLTGPEGMKTWTDLGLAMPSRPDLSQGWIAKFPDRAPFLAQGSVAKPWQLGAGGQKFFDDANSVLQALFAGQIDTKTAAAQMAEKAKADIKLA